MADQKIIETFNTTPQDRIGDNGLNAPAFKDTRVRVHIDKAVDPAAPELADNVAIDLSKFPQGTEFNVRKFGDKGIAISARSPNTNAVFEFVFDNAQAVKQIEVINNNGTRTVDYLNQVQMVPGPNGLPATVYSPNKLPMEEIRDTFRKTIEGNGFKFYQEDPAVDKKKGTTIPNVAPQTTTAYVSPIPSNGGKEKLGLA